MRNLVGITTITLFLLIMFTSFMSNAASDQESNEQTEAADTSTTLQSPERKKSDEDDVEVIGVVGQKSLAYFRAQMEIAELDFYDLFNELAEEEKFKIKCRRENRTGSNIKSRVCYPQYVLDRFAQETQDAMNSGRPYPTLADIESLVHREREASNEYAEKLVTENPILLKKLIALNNSQAMYEKKKAEN